MRKSQLVLFIAILCIAACDSSSKTNGVSSLARPDNKTCIAGPKPASEISVDFINAFPKLVFDDLIQIYRMPEDNQYWFAITRTGHIFRFSDDRNTAYKKKVLDISGKVDYGYQEQGLLGMAFHPRFQVNKKVYVYYTRRNVADPDNNVLTEFTYRNGLFTDETTIMKFPKKSKYHNGGNIMFGKDGYLYIGIGDDGGAVEDNPPSQDLTGFKGKLLRINVPGDGTYDIPQDNPFLVDGKVSPVYAYGFRNPWRWSFDRLTNELWLGDVGKRAFEEINVVEPGGNYGWPYKEGFACYFEGCESIPDLIDPVAAYGHDVGFVIIGGFVYRGGKIPQLYGKYVFTDGDIWAMERGINAISLGLIDGVRSFSEDVNGEIYINHRNGIAKMVPGKVNPEANPVAVKLSETGCFTPDNGTLITAEGLVPFTVVAPLYSDGANKSRWMAIPDSVSAILQPDGDIQFPVGSILAKEFSLQGKKIETRLLMRHLDGSWAGYTYQWNDEQDEAFLVLGGRTINFENFDYQIPSETQCMQCHNSSVGFAIGPTSYQLDMEVEAGDGTISNQLAEFQNMSLIVGNNAVGQSIVDYHNTAHSDEDRITSYLYANCHYCHNPDGPGRGGLDFRINTLQKWNRCGVAPQIDDLGIPDALIMYAGDPQKSILYKRISSTGSDRMPPLGRTTADPLIEPILKNYIESAVCP